MIISLNWLKKYVDIDVSVEELVRLIGARLVEVEDVKYIGDKYKDVVVARVAEVSKLEGSDHLSVVLIDDGRAVSGVDRADTGLVQVVCGAPNVKKGALVAWLPPSSIVPETYDDEEPFVLSARPLRGVVSNGMLASAKELDLYDEHEGILIIDKDVEPGVSFRDVYELDDYILDIENKSLTHRPDAFGIVGFAREVAAIQGKVFEAPEWLIGSKAEKSDSPVKLSILDKEASSGVRAAVLDNFSDLAKSSVEMQSYLSRSGVRPISGPVDVTNYLMLLTGQPLHVYDYDKFVEAGGRAEAELGVRYARAGETLKLLDGREVELGETDIVIVSSDVVVGLAGAMGGASTAVDENTTKVILEAATFNLYNLRSTQMRHGVFSEAVTRFTKGVPVELSGYVIEEAVRMLSELSEAHIVGGIAESVELPDSRNIQVSLDFINNLLGFNLSSGDVVDVLNSVNIPVTAEDGVFSLQAPYWRHDLSIPEDIAEEVGRILGFDTVNITLPMKNTEAVLPFSFDRYLTHLRRSLTISGSNEVLTYSFVHEDVLIKSGIDAQKSFKIINSISPELQRYRQSISPSLLGLLHANIKSGYSEFALYEINKIHSKVYGLNDEGVPVEKHSLALSIVTPKTTSAPYYYAKRYLDFIAERLNSSFTLQPLGDEHLQHALSGIYEPKRSAAVLSVEGEFIGVVGEYKKSVRDSFKAPENSAGFEVYLDKLFENSNALNDGVFSKISKYPGTSRDICFQVDESVKYIDVVSSVREALSGIDLDSSVDPVDIYKGDSSDVRNVTVRISLVSHERTLNGDEVNNIIDKVIDSVVNKTGGKVI